LEINRKFYWNPFRIVIGMFLALRWGKTDRGKRVGGKPQGEKDFSKEALLLLFLGRMGHKSVHMQRRHFEEFPSRDMLAAIDFLEMRYTHL
jgi:hypothetical protein